MPLHLASIEFLRGLGQRPSLATYDVRLAEAARALAIPLADIDAWGATGCSVAALTRLRSTDPDYDSKGEPLPSKGSRKFLMETSETRTASGVLRAQRTASAIVSGGMKRSS